MSDPVPTPPEGRVQHARRINGWCDEFEHDWQERRRPTIEGYLLRASGEERDELFGELLGLEIEFRRRAGEAVDFGDYRRRFPEHLIAVDAAEGESSATVRYRMGTISDVKPVEERLSSARDSARQMLGRTIAQRYVVDRYLGAGGMGCVFQAREQRLDRWVALKLLRAELAADPLGVKRFHREMRATVRVQHPNTVRVYDYGTSEAGELFLATEYLDGRTLDAELQKEKQFDAERIDRIGLQIAKALAAAHFEGIVHRDLKPQNVILVDQYGERDFVKVLDFGLACFTRAEATAESVQLSGEHAVIGTPCYMSPELISGKRVDERADLYALGALLFRMATGREPFLGTATAVMMKHVGEAPPKPTSLVASIPDWLERLILRLLEKDPARRLQTADEVAQWFDRSRVKVAVPADEADRLAALRNLDVLDSEAEQAFDDLTSLASYICGTPLAAISLVDEDRQWFKSKVGMSGSETSRNISFCTHTILGDELFMVCDATQDARFADSPLVTNNPQLRFYAGMPLTTSDGHNVGAVCVMDRKARQLNPDQIAALASIGRLVQSQLEMRRDLAILRAAAAP